MPEQVLGLVLWVILSAYTSITVFTLYKLTNELYMHMYMYNVMHVHCTWLVLIMTLCLYLGIAAPVIKVAP